MNPGAEGVLKALESIDSINQNQKKNLQDSVLMLIQDLQVVHMDILDWGHIWEDKQRT
ncbi:hypothetical protein NARC_60117 [Candidatus Nitrosocosmicus arcticus]|uniref:Uncharacterized protein n=1 Tax=Candidatus Nitrosocosmicus arcticus TaxID=2035267 RepID=A0A557SVU9_9ARCH|nr:hypothetical protein [Candidatus Nitrosocosmicus arcticus]TVP40730.1 hypothetical protein NARC_60117 [Candidatus Nitrosocosmicus arcticus]